jgi:hypothetical protein
MRYPEPFEQDHVRSGFRQGSSGGRAHHPGADHDYVRGGRGYSSPRYAFRTCSLPSSEFASSAMTISPDSMT